MFKIKDEEKHHHCQEKIRRCQEKREEKHRKRQEKRERKNRYKEEKREEKQRHREAKRRLHDELIGQFFNPSTISETATPNNNNYNIQQSNVRLEHDVATLRTIFPDCDPEFIRNCLANETEDPVRKVAEKLLTTTYPKVLPVSHLTPPTAPPLPTRNSCEIPLEEEAPPSYEESVGKQFLQPPPLPRRHQRSSSWNGTEQQTQSTQSSRDIHSASEVADAFVKTLISSFKPSTVENACHKYSYIWSRPVPSYFRPKPLSQLLKVLPKDKYSIQKGFHQSGYPSRDLRSHDISEVDWHSFISGLNSLIGVNSVKSGSNNLGTLGEGLSVSLKWFSWINVAMDDKLMDSNIKVLNEYINKWNNNFFIPRQIMVQFIDDKTPITVTDKFHFKEKHYPFVQYLLVKPI